MTPPDAANVLQHLDFKLSCDMGRTRMGFIVMKGQCKSAASLAVRVHSCEPTKSQPVFLCQRCYDVMVRYLTEAYEYIAGRAAVVLCPHCMTPVPTPADFVWGLERIS